jgi:hypothetical protein
MAYNQFEGTGFRPDPIELMDFELGMWPSIGILIAMFVVYRTVAFVFLAAN